MRSGTDDSIRTHEASETEVRGIEKAKIESDVMRLSRLRGQHDEDQCNARRRLHMMEEHVRRLEHAMTAPETDLRQRVDTRGENFKIMLVGRTYEERAEAGAMLIGLVDRQKSARGPVELGSFARFQLEFRPFVQEKVTLGGAMSYDANVSGNPLGVISSLERATRSIEERIANAREGLARTRQSITEMSALMGLRFEHESRFREVVARQAELVQALDLNKNKSSTGLAADTEEGPPSESPVPIKALVEKANVTVAVRPGAKKSACTRIAV